MLVKLTIKEIEDFMGHPVEHGIIPGDIDFTAFKEEKRKTNDK